MFSSISDTHKFKSDRLNYTDTSHLAFEGRWHPRKSNNLLSVLHMTSKRGFFAIDNIHNTSWTLSATLNKAPLCAKELAYCTRRAVSAMIAQTNSAFRLNGIHLLHTKSKSIGDSFSSAHTYNMMTCSSRHGILLCPRPFTQIGLLIACFRPWRYAENTNVCYKKWFLVTLQSFILTTCSYHHHSPHAFLLTRNCLGCRLSPFHLAGIMRIATSIIFPQTHH